MTTEPGSPGSKDRAAVREANEKYAESRGKRALELYQKVREITRR